MTDIDNLTSIPAVSMRSITLGQLKKASDKSFLIEHEYSADKAFLVFHFIDGRILKVDLEE